MLLEVLLRFYRFAGSLTCHQIPARSIEAGGVYIHICSRDTGIYLGAVVSILFIHLTKRTGADRPPALKYGIVFCIMLIPMILDGMTSYLGLRPSNNDIRLFTGMLFGIPLPFLLFPLLNFKVDGNNKTEIIKGWNELFIAVITAVGLGFAVLGIENLHGSAAKVMVFVISTALIFSQVYIYFKLCQTIVSLFWKGSRTGGIAASALAMAAGFFILYVISHYILQPLRIIYGI